MYKLHKEQQRSHISPGVCLTTQCPKPKGVEAAAAYHRLAVDRYSRIIAEYLTYTFMGNTRDITLTPTIKRKKIAKKKKI